MTVNFFNYINSYHSCLITSDRSSWSNAIFYTLDIYSRLWNWKYTAFITLDDRNLIKEMSVNRSSSTSNLVISAYELMGFSAAAVVKYIYIYERYRCTWMHMHTYMWACPSVQKYLIPAVGCICILKIKTQMFIWNFILLNTSDTDRMCPDIQDVHFRIA